ncbi:trimeric intracellular cation channel family protein [Raoultibacter massiliensis]|uniref:Trimeric intracellular cation channel family protein n=1 Tax=Raoultibacter massiliensis TaxID=1852371 RepID=A0ABV1JAK4_9ACTN|nr:trimeric intracellular cation channel family protein [Raoultibacter massiliensis]
MLETVLAVPFWLELAAALTGGLSGAMSAVRARYDIFGTVCIACTCGLLGGVIRDVLLQNYGIYAFQKPTLILACAIAGVVVFYFGKLATYLDPIVDLLDNISVALWAVISVGKGLSAGLDIIPSIILGTITAVGGGIMRDVFMNREPEAFQAGTLYGSAALIGSTAFALMKQNHLPEQLSSLSHMLDQWAPFACVALVLILRYASLLFGWRTKPPRDYSDVVTKAVARPVKSVARRVKPPKGKIEREKEKELQASGRLIRIRKRKPDLEQASQPSDPSDRILVKDLSEIREETAAEPKDPFEPQTPDPRTSNDRTLNE